MSYVSLQRAVAQRLRDGQSFGSIERWIEQLPVADEMRAALWIYAWAHRTERPTRERELVAVD